LANAGFILLIGGVVAWLWSNGKLQSMLDVIRGTVSGSNQFGGNNKSGPLYGGQGLLFG